MRKTTSASNRRNFLKTSSMAGAAVLAAPAIARRPAPTIASAWRSSAWAGGGAIPTARPCWNWPRTNVEIAAVCDCDERRMQAAAENLEKRGGKRPATVLDDAEDPGRQIDRRREPGHAQPLARPRDDLGLPGRQGRLRRETRLAQHLRGTQDGRGGAEV